MSGLVKAGGFSKGFTAQYLDSVFSWVACKVCGTSWASQAYEYVDKVAGPVRVDRCPECRAAPGFSEWDPLSRRWESFRQVFPHKGETVECDYCRMPSNPAYIWKGATHCEVHWARQRIESRKAWNAGLAKKTGVSQFKEE